MDSDSDILPDIENSDGKSRDLDYSCILPCFYHDYSVLGYQTPESASLTCSLAMKSLEFVSKES